jgi:RNA polymerase sigma-70 factor (ECF subfamily)
MTDRHVTAWRNWMIPTDEELAARAVTDREALAELYRRYTDWIYAFCKQRLGTRQAAEDATSLVFARVLAGIHRFEPKPTFRAWIFTIAQNIVTDSHRRSARIRFSPLDETWDGASPDHSPEDLAIASDERDFVRRLMTCLTADQRAVIELRLAELTGPEIQAVLGRSRAWVNTTQHRALLRMRAAAEQEAEQARERFQLRNKAFAHD